MKKILKRISVILFLILLLTLSYTEFEMPSLSVYGTKIDASSTSSESPTDKSSKKTDKGSSGSKDIDLLARVINAEARGEPYLGQVAVGAVIMNRVKSAEFPNTISGVVYQKGQFSSVKDGQINKAYENEEQVRKAAQEAYNGSDPTNGALYFYNPKTAKSKWLYTRPTLKTIGSHRFAK